MGWRKLETGNLNCNPGHTLPGSSHKWLHFLCLFLYLSISILVLSKAWDVLQSKSGINSVEKKGGEESVWLGTLSLCINIVLSLIDCFHVLDHFLYIYTLCPGPWKTEISMEHTMNDHQCYSSTKITWPIYKPQEMVFAQDTVWISNLKNGKPCQSPICFFYLLFPKLALTILISLPLLMLFPWLRFPTSSNPFPLEGLAQVSLFLFIFFFW